MRAYDPGQPLISLHVPKCAGQSMRRLLRQWFGDALLFHYNERTQVPPIVHPWRPGICIHGHFNNRKRLGANDYYPQATQYITVLRDPLEMAISNYFFWKRKARGLQIAQGRLLPGSEHDYRCIDDFFRMRPRSVMFDFLPAAMETENWRTFIDERFVWIGTVENLSSRVGLLASALAVAPSSIPHINESARSETLSPELERQFRETNRLEQELYEHVRALEEAGADR